MSAHERALVLDFDGLVADTEVLWLAVLTRLYRSLSQELPHDLYVASIGGTLQDFNPFEDLAARCGTISAAELERRGENLFRTWMTYEAPLPGVRRLVTQAERLGLPLAIASSSRSASVIPHLESFGLLESFSVVVTSEDVPRVKPAPDLYLRAAQRLGVEPTDILAFEDSYRGVRAATAAGALCVAVPHVLSRTHDFSDAALRLDSLALCDVEDLLLLPADR
ncbi:HAD-IA family hydrolase [Streptomyces sp. NBC_00513]|uniref:HAD family hydrolase n=1 Tax=unclassified Streptomyces TaxID=2593676 RepID=UPI002250D8BB|nr:HAD-IA family hydrolase [Streptomyces sp. NBC_00424]MCX5071237.1 HAD-IA family hydrolase [Streptomyces sp. NBC_00424]WUD45346.1 HAD-IA family hydrolase [Streptomyces sp. NBC_00513]